jgi:hypothetical protein
MFSNAGQEVTGNASLSFRFYNSVYSRKAREKYLTFQAGLYRDYSYG